MYTRHIIIEKYDWHNFFTKFKISNNVKALKQKRKFEATIISK